MDGEVEIKIGGTLHVLKAGNMIIMPVNLPHAVFVISPFKMLLTIIKSRYFIIRKFL
ncbi:MULTISPECIES: hypothetical protein [Dysgonomonas]|uniref:hypothetical protein n=1 Tax=Dysgonomonas TaxID=156973 RepID=UPI003342BAF7